MRIIRELLSLGLTVEDVRGCADRLQLLDGDTLPPRGGPGCSMASGVVQRRLAALDAEITRLSRVRDQLAARAGVEEEPETA
ncbi:MerR, DNA binding [Streptosporangium subroseum]|uniref:MerR, DNA binding n=1 Tax=Streptosporangium subroseum TaxID=106412 RepID=A0A239PD91_9ACTN|nr:MerR family DNA-binding protein [Streptosporangium subroseum]SNT64608.1 MerR, DNA binding [Streptosporangium subroseum]